MNLPTEPQPPLFDLGRVLTTTGALAALTQVRQSPQVFLARHVQGDWGDMDPADLAANAHALAQGRRLFSAYTLPSGIRLWIMTAANRTVTQVLLPLEYEKESMTMKEANETGGRLAGCQSTNHTECYGELWQCAACGKTVCYAEGTDNHPELCDECWAQRFAPTTGSKPSGVRIQEDETLLMDCTCTEAECATWLALTPEGTLTLEDKDGLCVSILLPDWLNEALHALLMTQVHSDPQGQGEVNQPSSAA